MAYIAVRNFYVGNDLYQIGDNVEISDNDKIQELLTDGHIEQGGSSDATPLADLPEVVATEPTPQPQTEVPVEQPQETPAPTVEQQIQNDVLAPEVSGEEVSVSIS